MTPLDNALEVSFYMETPQFVDMAQVAATLAMPDAAYYSKGQVQSSRNKRVQIVSSVSYYSFGFDRHAASADKIGEVLELLAQRQSQFAAVFAEHDFERTLFIYTWPGQDNGQFELSAAQVCLLAELDVALSVVHYGA